MLDFPSEGLGETDPPKNHTPCTVSALREEGPMRTTHHILATTIVQTITVTPTALVDPTVTAVLDPATPIQIMIMIVPVLVLIPARVHVPVPVPAPAPVLIILALDPDPDPALATVRNLALALAPVHAHAHAHLPAAVTTLLIIARIEGLMTFGRLQMRTKPTQTFRSSLHRIATTISSSRRLLFRGVLAYVRRMFTTSLFVTNLLRTR